MESKQYDALPVPLPEDYGEEILEQIPLEKDPLEETVLNEPPEKRAKLEIPPLEQVRIWNGYISRDLTIVTCKYSLAGRGPVFNANIETLLKKKHISIKSQAGKFRHTNFKLKFIAVIYK